MKINSGIWKSVLLVAFGLFFGWLLFHQSKPVSNETEAHQHDVSTTWTCSMHPQIRESEPGQCPICGMDLVPITQTGNEDMGVLVMTEAAMKLASVQTTIVGVNAAERTLILSGKVAVDESRVFSQTAHFPGRIEQIFVRTTGQFVQRGEKIASVYSPEIITAQEELIVALRYKDSNPVLVQAARNKLKYWKLSEGQIKQIEERGSAQTTLPIRADISGIVMQKLVNQGDHLMQGGTLYQIADLTKVWVIFDAYEDDLAWIHLGDVIDFNVASLPGKKFTGKVSFIDPVINQQTRTAGVRIEVDNQQMELKPEMFVSGKGAAKSSDNSEMLSIPKTAVLWTGKRSVVYVKDPNQEQPVFSYREVVLGDQMGENYIVLEGLKQGDEIATNGVFKIDAAAQLEGKPSMMNPEGGKVSTGHDHGQLDGSKQEQSHKPAQNSPNYIDPSFQKQLQSVYQKYQDLSLTLVSSDPKGVKKSGQKLNTALKKVDMGLVKGTDHQTWMNQLEKINLNLKAILNSEKIQEQRDHFAHLSEGLYQSIKFFGISKGAIYYQYCPMALNNKGAFWLSSKEEIANPYFGNEMLDCGETKEIIN
ncbi:MAG: efflux RND transporter periplasmic adaptor subunit [Cyclobacteriaceae bacterium]